MDIKRLSRNSLSKMFLKQLLILSGCILTEIVIFIFAFIMCLQSGAVLPANYTEHYLVANEDKIKEIETFDESLVPHTCRYGLYDKDYKYIEGNMSEEVKNQTDEYLKGENVSGFFFIIEREDGYCIIQYDYVPHYANEFLDKYLINPQLICTVLFIIGFITIVILNAIYFSRKLEDDMKPLKEEIEFIKERNLNFEQRTSNIKEFDEILFSLYDMRMALSESLKKEWKSEQKRKSNISALAHDIKTPLTIIKGSAELINEEEDLSEIYDLAKTINSNSNKIESYIRLLIDQTKSNVVLKKNNTIVLEEFISQIKSESESLCKAQNIQLIVKDSYESKEITIDNELLERAIMNIIKNAIEHTKEVRKIIVNFEYRNSIFTVSVEDFGDGFSGKSEKYAKEEFYTENDDRGDHYGLGMYIADSIVKQYNGSLEYFNKDDNSGAIVILKFSC